MSSIPVVFEADPEKHVAPGVTESKATRLARHWRRDIRKDHSDIILLMCSFLSGFCDSGAFNAWSCFVCMQTGTSLHHSGIVRSTDKQSSGGNAALTLSNRQYHLPRAGRSGASSFQALRMASLTDSHTCVCGRLLHLLDMPDP